MTCTLILNWELEIMVQQDNLQLMKTLDDAWNSQDWETFKKRHAENAAIFWPGQPDPTKGRKAHYDECVEFFKTFPDNHLVNNPYKIMVIAQYYVGFIEAFRAINVDNLVISIFPEKISLM